VNITRRVIITPWVSTPMLTTTTHSVTHNYRNIPTN